MLSDPAASEQRGHSPENMSAAHDAPPDTQDSKIRTSGVDWEMGEPRNSSAQTANIALLAVQDERALGFAYRRALESVADACKGLALFVSSQHFG